MKIIKYQLATKIDLDGVMAVTLSGVTMPYTEANYAIAQAEAYQGQITAEDDGAPAPPPTAQEQLRADVDFLAAMQGVAL